MTNMRIESPFPGWLTYEPAGCDVQVEGHPAVPACCTLDGERLLALRAEDYDVIFVLRRGHGSLHRGPLPINRAIGLLRRLRAGVEAEPLQFLRAHPAALYALAATLPEALA